MPFRSGDKGMIYYLRARKNNIKILMIYYKENFFEKHFLRLYANHVISRLISLCQ